MNKIQPGLVIVIILRVWHRPDGKIEVLYYNEVLNFMFYNTY